MKYVPRVKLEVEPEEDYVLKHGLRPYIEKNLPKNTQRLMRDISEYRDRNYDTLGTPFLYTYPKFPEKNKENLFKYIGVTVDYVDELRKQVKNLPEWEGTNKTLYKNKANFTNEGSVMVLMMNYYKEHGQERYIEPLLRYLSYYQYFATYLSQFGKYEVNKAIMTYTINSLPNSFILKRVGNVDAMLWHGASSVYNIRPELIEVADDVCVWYMLDLVKARMNSFLRNVSANYYKNKDKDLKIFIDGKVMNAEGEALPDNSVSGNAATLADSATVNFFNSPTNYKIVNMCSKQFNVSETEIKTAINKLKMESNVEEVSQFYNCIFELYLSKYPDHSDVTIKSIKFAAAMDQIYKKGNSKNKNILMIKKLTDKWLKSASKTYRASNREGTINAFRKSIYFYFVYSIVMGEKE